MKSITLALVSGALLIGAGGAVAQQPAFPSKPVTLIVPNAAGTSTDQFARFFADQLSKKLNQPVLVDPTPGASGSIGVSKFLTRPADGYTVLFGTSATNAANYSLFNNLPYKATDLAPVACLYLLPPVVAVRSTLPVKTVAELAAYAKANPGKVTYGWGSTTSKVGGELFKARTGTDILGVPYKGSPQVMTDMLGGRIDMTVESAVVVLPHAEAGTMRILAVTSSSRLDSLPNIPTLEEAGLKDAVMTPWVGTFVKAGTPPEIIDKLNAAFGSVIASPEYAAMEAKAKSKSFMCSPQELGRFAQAETQKWADLVKLAGIEKE